MQKNIIDFEKKNMLPLTKKESKSHDDENNVIFEEKESKKKFKDINYRKVRHCHYTGKYRGAVHSICNLKFKVPNEIPVFFNKGSNYDYHFIIKEWVW